MPAFLLPFLEAVVPLLVTQAEKLFPSADSGSDKHAWVQGMVGDLLNAIATKFNAPAWSAPIIGEVEILLKGLIEKEVEKVDPTPAPTAA